MKMDDSCRFKYRIHNSASIPEKEHILANKADLAEKKNYIRNTTSKYGRIILYFQFVSFLLDRGWFNTLHSIILLWQVQPFHEFLLNILNPLIVKFP